MGMTFNKEWLKRHSGKANAVMLILGAAMVYFPDLVPAQYLPYVMCTGSVIIAACQVVKQNAQ